MTVVQGTSGAGSGAGGYSEGGEFEFAVGSLHGLRTWQLNNDGILTGAYGGQWHDGENQAACPMVPKVPDLVLVAATDHAYSEWCRRARISPGNRRLRLVQHEAQAAGYDPATTGYMIIADGFTPLAGMRHLKVALQNLYPVADQHAVKQALQGGRAPHDIPGPNSTCGCGFWSYWTLAEARRVYWPARPVMGVIEGYGKTRIGDRGFRCSKAKIVAVYLAFDLDGKDGQHVKSGLECLLQDKYPSVRVYCTAEAMLAMHPPTQDYLPEPEPVAEVRIPQVLCPAGMPLGMIERKIPGVNVQAIGGSPLWVPGAAELTAKHDDGSDCGHLARFLATGGQVAIVHTTGGVTAEYRTASGQALSPAIGGGAAAIITAGGGGGGGGVFHGGAGGSGVAGSGLPPGIGGSAPGWTATATSAQMAHALSWGMTHHPNGQPRAAGGNSSIYNSP